MSVLQFVPRFLMAHKELATMTITRMYDTAKLPRRRKIVELQKADETGEPCYKSVVRSENRCLQPNLKSMLDDCLDPCDQMPMPMDFEHYTPSDKEVRKYQRTWCECYRLPKKYVQIKKRYPERKRRNLRRRDTTYECVEALNVRGSSRKKPERLIPGTETVRMPCCKIPGPGCAPGRADPSCLSALMPSCCKKRRTQYPSFSECQPEGLLEPIPPCECIKKANMCEVWAYWRRRYDR